MDVNELNKEVQEYVESEFKNTKIEDFNTFQQNMIKENKLNIHSFTGLTTLGIICNTAIFCNYYADVQLTILKKYLETKKKCSLTDEEVIEIAQNTVLYPWLYILNYPVDILTSDERSRIYNNFALLSKLNDRKIFGSDSSLQYIVKCGESFQYQRLANRYITLQNVAKKAELDNQGLQEHINEFVPYLLDMEIPEDDEQEIYLLLRKPE